MDIHTCEYCYGESRQLAMNKDKYGRRVCARCAEYGIELMMHMNGLAKLYLFR